jgi:DNA-binding transcriptional ArsR family regulator
MRNITDVRTLRALAHPVRIAILEALAMSGPLTATQVGERIGESPTTCSFHLRQLAKYHFVEEAGGGKGRARPWRMSSTGLSISAGDDPETAIAANSVRRLFRDRAWERYRTWTETDQMYPLPWRKAAAETETVYFVTADELQALNEELHEIIMHRYRDRLTDPSRRPPGSVPVEMLLLSYPIQLPDQED